MKIAIIGYGSQGQSALEYYVAQGHKVTVCDINTDLILPENIERQLGENYLDNLDRFDLIVRSPSVHPKELKDIDPQKISSNTNEFIKVCPTKNIIGVTGTKGKGTTSTLIAKMLEASGFTVHLGGNIGTPPLEMLKGNIQADDWVVLELANFQLIDIKQSPYIAVCLMVVPEHLDWHADMDEYVLAKQQLFRWQKDGDIAIYYADNENSVFIASAGKGKKIGFMQPPGARVENGNFVVEDKVICPAENMRLLGTHNYQNVCAAITAVWNVTQNIGSISGVISTFSGLEHRLEFVREVNGAKYYNDSFGTTPETAIVAYEAFSQPKIGIVGGSDKGIPFDRLAKTLANANVTALIAIGETGPVIAGLVRQQNPEIPIIEGLRNMHEIVTQAKELAQPGDIVLLSTGCASFGLFKDYKDRGDQFKKAVQELA